MIGNDKLKPNRFVVRFTSLTPFNTLGINFILLNASSLSLVIGCDTPEARDIARSYQHDVKLAAGVKLLICLYDSEKKEFNANIDVSSASHL